jgi:endonuclease/exonuclease/phosphatase family metal-dependent hydrolase
VPVRVLVYNVRGFRDGLERVATVVRRFAPDLVLLNESGARWRLRRLARAVDMSAIADPWSPLRRRVKNAILFRAPWRAREHRLVRFRASARLYPRGALLALLERPGAEVWAAVVHLGLRSTERRRHVEELLALIAGREPLLLGGDLNEHPERGAAKLLGERLADAWLLGGDADGETFPAREPTARIDYLFVSEGIRVERVIVPPLPEVRRASDHRPVVAELDLPERER